MTKIIHLLAILTITAYIGLYVAVTGIFSLPQADTVNQSASFDDVWTPTQGLQGEEHPFQVQPAGSL